MGAPLSQAVCNRLKVLCSVNDNRTVARITGIDEGTIGRTKRRGFVAFSHPKIRQRPHDFAIQADHMTLEELARHYRAGLSTVRRWAAEVGRQSMPPYLSPSKPMPDRDVIEAAIAEHGVKGAAAALGTSSVTLLKWRRKLGFKIRGSQPATVKAEPKVGWVERYVAAKSRQGGIAA